MDFHNLLAHYGFLGGIGEGAMRYWPQRSRSLVWGLLPLCHYWRKSITKYDRESVDRQTNRHMHRQRQTEFI